jgi:serine/threonine protein phosphatase PrpC
LYPVVSGEKLLLCSDGLSGEVTDDALVQTLTTQHDVQDAADALIRQALDAGGRDNVTVVIVEVVEGGLDSEIDEETGVIRARLGADDEDLEANTVEIPERVKSDG